DSKYPGVFRHEAELSDSYTEIIAFYFAARRWADAGRYCDEAIPVLERLARTNSDNAKFPVQVAECHYARSEICAVAGRAAEAEAAFSRCLAILERRADAKALNTMAWGRVAPLPQLAGTLHAVALARKAVELE